MYVAAYKANCSLGSDEKKYKRGSLPYVDDKREKKQPELPTTYSLTQKSTHFSFQQYFIPK